MFVPIFHYSGFQFLSFASQVRGDVGFSLPDFLNGGEKFPIGVFLKQVPVCTGKDGTVEVLPVIVHGQDQDLHIRVKSLDLPGCPDPSQLRHGYVENDHEGGERVESRLFFKSTFHFQI